MVVLSPSSKRSGFGLYYTSLYKKSIQEDIAFKSMSLAWSKRKLKTKAIQLQVSVAQVEQWLFYEAPQPVTKEKKKGMMDLLHLIPPMHHAYYLNRITNDAVENVGSLEELLLEFD